MSAAAATELVKEFAARMEQAEQMVSTLSQKLTRLEETNKRLKEKVAQQAAAKQDAKEQGAGEGASFPGMFFFSRFVASLPPAAQSPPR